MSLTALLLNCTLTPPPAPSSTHVMLDLVAEHLHRLDVGNEDGAHHVAAGVLPVAQRHGFHVRAEQQRVPGR